MKISHREKFAELATKRVNKALKDIKLIGNLSNRSNYQYTDDQVKKIMKALKDAVRDCENRYAKGGHEDEEEFKL